MCNHLWSGWATPLRVKCSWHRPRKPVGSCEWFSLGYRQAFGRIWCNIAIQIVPSFCNNWQSDELSLHFITNRPTVTDWRFLRAGRNSGMHMNVPYTTPLQDASQSSFVYVGEIKVRYFLNSGLCYKRECREFKTCQQMFSIYLILPSTLGPGVYSASSRNEYQKQKKKVSGE
jgi:hypothetical protein